MCPLFGVKTFVLNILDSTQKDRNEQYLCFMAKLPKSVVFLYRKLEWILLNCEYPRKDKIQVSPPHLEKYWKMVWTTFSGDQTSNLLAVPKRSGAHAIWESEDPL